MKKLKKLLGDLIDIAVLFAIGFILFEFITNLELVNL